MDYACFDVVIVPTFADINAFRCAHGQNEGLFAQTVTTFNGWIADLWELFGDGRQPITAIQREVALQRSYEKMRFKDGRISPGFVNSAAKCVREASGLDAFEAALVFAKENDDAGENSALPLDDRGCLDWSAANEQSESISEDRFESLSERELEFLRGIADYKELIAERSLVELGDALAILSRNAEELFVQPVNVLVLDAQPFTWQQARFYDDCENLTVTACRAEGEDGVKNASAGIEVRSAYVSGKYAEPAMIADIIRMVGEDGRVAVCCKDPLGVYDSIASRLASEDISCAVQTNKTFPQTTFGRAFLSMFHCVHDDVWDPSCLSDFLLSPFSGITKSDARKIDLAMKSNRIASRENYLASLRAVSDTFSQFEEIVSDPDADILLGVFENIALSHSGWTDAYKREQIAAIGAFREVAESARSLGVSLSSCEHILSRCSFDVSRGNMGDAREAPQVLIASQRAASRLAPGEFATLVVCDLNSVDYPIADKDDSVSTLLERIGLTPSDTALNRARRDFCALQKIPSKRLVLERATHDENAEETYRCAMLEEFFDSYRTDALDEGTVDAVGDNEKEVAPSLGERGEELLYANAASLPRNASQPMGVTIGAVNPSHVSDSCKPFMMATRSRNGSDIVFGQSPSQVELYLECPYRWFASRRLKTESLGESLGPIEKGLFAHEALETFYKRFIDEGFGKVNAVNLDKAKTLMADVVAELAADQVKREPGSGRLVATSQIEAREIESFKRQLVDYLDYEAEFLPNFIPKYFEYQIGENNRVSYAGYDLLGKIDRIDVDANGNAVIIDYKGSVSDEHNIAGKNDDRAGKVQTRIYAQAVQRILGLKVVGAFYVSYGKHHAIAGAYDPLVLDAAHLPGINPKRSACSARNPQAVAEEGEESLSYLDYTFETMLDETEELVSHAIGLMNQGSIEMNPSSSDVCSLCPVVNCSKRGA